MTTTNNDNYLLPNQPTRISQKYPVEIMKTSQTIRHRKEHNNTDNTQ